MSKLRYIEKVVRAVRKQLTRPRAVKKAERQFLHMCEQISAHIGFHVYAQLMPYVSYDIHKHRAEQICRYNYEYQPIECAESALGQKLFQCVLRHPRIGDIDSRYYKRTRQVQNKYAHVRFVIADKPPELTRFGILHKTPLRNPLYFLTQIIAQSKGQSNCRRKQKRLPCVSIRAL